MPGKILVVEDNPQNVKLVLMVLRPHGHTLLEAGDGETALETALREQPDLVILDINLPRMNGLELTRQLREQPATSGTPVIAITACAMKGDQERIMQAGCDAYMSKPINTRELPGLVAEMLQKKRRASGSDNGKDR